jgi:uridine kinase
MPQQKTKPIVVGVAGGTASGKSKFCSALQQHLPQGRVLVLQLDSYYHCRADIPPSDREQINYDHPASLDFELMTGQLHELCNGGSVQVPVYDFSTHTRDARTVEVSSTQIILVEGILALYWKELRDLYDLKIFLEAREEVRLHRRIDRDTSERGRTQKSVMHQWKATVQPMAEEYCMPTKQFSDLVVSGETPYDSILYDVVCRISDLRKWTCKQEGSC